jgi:hypothetical protein
MIIVAKQKVLLILILIISICVLTINSAQAKLDVRNNSGEVIPSNDKQPAKDNPFQLGQWAIPIFVTNVILLIVGVLYYKKKIPLILLEWMNKLYNFEVSPKVSWIIVVSLLAIFVGFSIDKFQHSDEVNWGDYQVLEAAVKNYNFNSILDDLLNIRYILHFVSLHVFGNIRVIAFFESISLIVLTYLLTITIAKKRFAGIVAIIILIQSSLFQKYSVTATYDNLWTLFYVLSLYLIYKKWFLSPISYFLSILSKPLTSFFLPFTFFFIYKASTKENKKRLTISYLVILGLVVVHVVEIYKIEVAPFSLSSFVTGFLAFGNFLKYDGIVTVFLLPLVIVLFLLSRKGFTQVDSVMLLISGVILSGLFLQGFVEITNEPYRYVPLVVFFAIGVGILFSDKKSLLLQTEKKYSSYATFGFTLVIVITSLVLTIFPTLVHGSYRMAL